MIKLNLQKPILKNALKFLVIFIVSLPLFIFLWSNIKDPYGYLLTKTSSILVTKSKTVRLLKLESKGDENSVFYYPDRFGVKPTIAVEVSLKTSHYTYNLPISLALICAFFPFIKKKKRRYIEVLFLLILIHFIYVYIYQIGELNIVLAERGYEKSSSFKSFFSDFFVDYYRSLVLRFEPVLVGIYLFFTNFR